MRQTYFGASFNLLFISTHKHKLNQVFAAVLLLSNSLGYDFLFVFICLGRLVFTKIDEFSEKLQTAFDPQPPHPTPPHPLSGNYIAFFWKVIQGYITKISFLYAPNL